MVLYQNSGAHQSESNSLLVGHESLYRMSGQSIQEMLRHFTPAWKMSTVALRRKLWDQQKAHCLGIMMPVQRLMAIYPAFVETQSGGLTNIAAPRVLLLAWLKKKWKNFKLMMVLNGKWSLLFTWEQYMSVQNYMVIILSIIVKGPIL